MHDLLYAYFISDEDIDIQKLRNSLQKDLPTYMIPQHFLRLNEWPYNSNGKINKKALPLAETTETKAKDKPAEEDKPAKAKKPAARKPRAKKEAPAEDKPADTVSESKGE